MTSLILLKLLDLNCSIFNIEAITKASKGIKKLNKIDIKNKKIPFSLFKSYLKQDKKHKAGFKNRFCFYQKTGTSICSNRFRKRFNSRS